MALARPLLLLLALLGLTTAVPIPAPAAAPIDFWNVPRPGGNSFNGTPPDQAYFDALAGYGATWVRLVYDKWTPARRDFLIGDADHYDGLIAADLATLKQEIARAHRAGLKTVVTPPSLRSAEHTSELQSLMRTSYAVSCLTKKKTTN